MEKMDLERENFRPSLFTLINSYPIYCCTLNRGIYFYTELFYYTNNFILLQRRAIILVDKL